MLRKAEFGEQREDGLHLLLHAHKIGEEEEKMPNYEMLKCGSLQRNKNAIISLSTCIKVNFFHGCLNKINCLVDTP